MTPFVSAYIAAALWSSTGPNDEPLDKHFDERHLAPETLAKIIEDCAKFIAQNWADLSVRKPELGAHDFWLTRNHHGAGFWDGDWPEPPAERLTEAAHAFGECNLYIGDDGLIYC